MVRAESSVANIILRSAIVPLVVVLAAGRLFSQASEVAELGREALSKYRAGELEEALSLSRRAAFLAPADRRLQGLLRTVAAKLARAKVREAKGIVDEKRDEAVALLVEAHELDPGSGAARELSRLSYRFHRGAWRTREEIEEFEKEEAEREEGARERLHLDDGYRLRRTDHFRVFTNMPEGRQWERWLVPVLEVMESHFRQYRWMFQGEVDVRAAQEGMDVVFFKDEEDYMNYLERNDIRFSFQTAGCYSPLVRSCFFYRNPNYASVWPILLHELTHEFNDLILHSARVTWINEGLAQYFEGAIVNKDYSVTIGRPYHDMLSQLRLRGLDEPDYVPAARVLAADSVDDPSAFAGTDVTQAYALMWAWTYFLLHNEEKHRELLLEGIRREREFWKSPPEDGDPNDVYEKAFADFGLPLEKIDEEFRTFVRNIPLTATRSG